jgi:hypothetical protein
MVTTAYRDWRGFPSDVPNLADLDSWYADHNYSDRLVEARTTTLEADVTALDTRVTTLETTDTGTVYKYNTANVSNGTTTTAVIDMTLGVDLVAGQVYTASFDAHWYGSVLNDWVRFQLVGASTTPIYATWDYHAPRANQPTAIHQEVTFEADGTETSMNLRHFRIIGTGTVYAFAQTSSSRHISILVVPVPNP